MTETTATDTITEAAQLDATDVDAGQTAAGADEQTTDVGTRTPSHDDQQSGVSDDTEAQDDTPDGNSRAGRDFAKLRAQLAERDTLIAERDTQLAAAHAALAAQQRAIVDRIAGEDGPAAPRTSNRRAAVTPELMDANGFQLADVLDESGNVDPAAVEAFAAATAERFRIMPKTSGFAPNRAQGGLSLPPGAIEALTGGNKGGMADAFRTRGAGVGLPGGTQNGGGGMYNGYPV